MNGGRCIGLDDAPLHRLPFSTTNERHLNRQVLSGFPYFGHLFAARGRRRAYEKLSPRDARIG